MSWTPEREEKLKELWKKGHTASQIANLCSRGYNKKCSYWKSPQIKFRSKSSIKKIYQQQINNEKKENQAEELKLQNW